MVLADDVVHVEVVHRADFGNFAELVVQAHEVHGTWQ